MHGVGFLEPGLASAIADAILVVHLGVVGFVVVGEALFLVGGKRGWAWVRRRGLRLLHLAMMVFIAVQAWLGQACPLTVWEQSLRHQGGQSTYRESFIEHWLARVLYVEAPWWAFVAAYSVFALLVALTWRLVPPQPRRR